MQSAPNSSRSDGASEVRDRTGSGSSARSRAGSAGRAIGSVKLVAQNASDLPTVETSAPSDSAAASGVQIVVTGPDGIARSVTFDRTDRLQEAFMIMQSAGLLPPDQLPWYTQDQQLSVADKVRFGGQNPNRMSDEFAFCLGGGAAPSALISSAELEQGTRASGDINTQMHDIPDIPSPPSNLQPVMAQAHIANYNPTQLNAVRQSEQRLSDLYDVGRLSEDLSAMVNVNAQGGDITSADFDWTGSRDGAATAMNARTQPEVPQWGMEIDHERISDPRISARDSERESSMDAQVLGTLLQHANQVKQQAQAATANEFSMRRTSSEALWEMLQDDAMPGA